VDGLGDLADFRGGADLRFGEEDQDLPGLYLRVIWGFS